MHTFGLFNEVRVWEIKISLGKGYKSKIPQIIKCAGFVLKVTGLGLEPRTLSLKGRCSTN